MMSTPKLDFVRLFTDGACKFNPGPGGWAFILEHPATGKTRKEAGAEPKTTNNRMELTAAIQGLEALKNPCSVELVTDSQYVAKGIAEWLPGWKARGWKRKEKGKLVPVINEDLWRTLDGLVQRHEVNVRHVYGHSGHPQNEECDRMAVAAYQDLIRFSKSG